MNFLTPWFLLGAAAVAGPIVFHLIRRAARERVAFSSLMFLRPTPPRAVRRSKLEHIVLLCLRCLCLLLLAVGFARPFFARDILPPPASAQERRLILLVDDSASMRREGLWDKAAAKARDYLDQATASDQVAVMAFDLQPRGLVSFADWNAWPESQRATLAKQRLATAKPGWMGTHLGAALTGAAEQFRENSVARREIVLITDLQEGAKLDGLQGYSWPSGTLVKIERVEAKPQSDAGLEILEPRALVAGTEDAIHVRVANSSDSRSEKFRLGWPGATNGMEVYLTPGQTRSFTAPKPPAGLKSGTLELPGSSLPYGAASTYVAPEIQRVTICAEGLGLPIDPNGMLYYLQRVFPGTPRRQIAFAPRLEPEASFAVIATNLAPDEAAQWRGWLESGKTALLVLAGADSGPTLAGLLGLPDAQVAEAGGEYALLGSIDFQHPIFAPFSDPRFSDFSQIHFWKHRRWDIPASAQARVLARFDDGSPALAQVPVKKGNLLVLASGWSPADSQFAVSSKFPPLMETMLDWSGAGAPVRFQFRTGDAIPCPVLTGESVRWQSPDGHQSTLAAGAPFTETDTPGVYRADFHGKQRLFAVNVPLEESRTAPISPDELARLGVPLKWDSEQSAASARVQQQRLKDSELENRQKLWRWLIAAALTVTFMEIVLGGWLARRPAADRDIMMEPRLQTELAAAELALRRTRLWRELRVGWLGAGGLALLCLIAQGASGWTSPALWIVPLLAGLAAAIAVVLRHEKRQVDFPEVVAALETTHPELRHLLSAAAEQQPGENGFSFLQLRVVEEVLAHPQRQSWNRRLEQKLAAAKIWGLCSLAAMMAVLLALGYGSRREQPVLAALLGGVQVTPGDVQVERGSSLVISARFGGDPPAEASLVLVSASGKTRRLALERHLADPVFGASLSEVDEDGRYHVEYAGGQTADYKITVFDYPSLTRADATLAYPAYTGLTHKTIPDTRRISAIEGTLLTYNLQLNKPVKSARLVSPEQTLDLQLASNAVAVLPAFPLTNSARFFLALEDAEGRTNKFPADFVLQVLTNHPPMVKLDFPRGDQRVSSLEEIQLQAEAAGDFGLVKYGIGFGIAGENPQLVELGGPAPGKDKRSFNYLLSLEKLKVQEDQVIGYFAWAEDHGPDGKPRRTFSDIFFAEVRPFEEIFRPDQSGEGDSQGGQGGKGQQNEKTKLADLQKDIVIATWKLQQNIIQ